MTSGQFCGSPLSTVSKANINRKLQHHDGHGRSAENGQGGVSQEKSTSMGHKATGASNVKLVACNHSNNLVKGISTHLS